MAVLSDLLGISAVPKRGRGARGSGGMLADQVCCCRMGLVGLWAGDFWACRSRSSAKPMAAKRRVSDCGAAAGGGMCWENAVKGRA